MIEIFSPKFEVMVSYVFQAWYMCSHYRMETSRVVMVWCVRCALKGLITSQTPLSWQGRHPKCLTNIWWKFWHAFVNIHVSSNSSPSMQRPWRLTHCGGMGELFKKCWSTTWNAPPLWNLIVARGVDTKKRTWLVTFRWNHVKLT
jgi:hypothetical protein